MADRSLTFVFLGKDAGAGATAEAIAAKLKALGLAEDDVGKKADTMGKKHEQASTAGFKPLLDTALLLGPALVPIAAGAAAAAVGLGALGLTAIAAFKGIQAEMQNNTILGEHYKDAFKPVVEEWQQLQHVAAAGVFDGLNRGIQATTQLFPQVNKTVAELSVHLGDIAGNVGASFVNIFRQASPLFGTLARQLDLGSAALLRWSSSSDGVGKFVTYAQEKLPQVESTIGNIALAIGKLVVAAGPLGGAVLNAISALASAIAAIPVPVLTGLLAALQVSRIVSIGNALGNLAAGFGTVETAASSALGPLAAIATAVAVFHGQVQQYVPDIGINIEKLTSTVDSLNKDYTSGVDAFGQSITSAFEKGGTAAYDLSTKAALAATSLGPVQAALAVTGQTVASFSQAIQGTDPQWKLFTQNVYDGELALTHNKGAAQDLVNQMNQLRDAFTQGKITGQQYNEAMSTLGLTAAGTEANLFGLTQEQLQAKAAAAEAAKAIQDEVTALHTLQDATLSAEQQELAFKSSIAQAAQQIKDHKSSLIDDSAAGRDNKAWILQQIGALNQHADTVYKSTGSLKAMDGALSSDEAQLRTAAAAAGFNTGQVNQLINAYAHVPANVSTYIKGIDGASGVIQSVDGQLRTLDGRVVYTTIVTQHEDIFTVQDAASNRGAAGVTSRAVGGPLSMGWNLVGEQGPELIQFHGARAMVYTAQQTVRMLPSVANQVDRPVTHVTVNVSGSVVSERDLVSAVRDGLDSQRRQRGRGSLLDA